MFSNVESDTPPLPPVCVSRERESRERERERESREREQREREILVNHSQGCAQTFWGAGAQAKKNALLSPPCCHTAAIHNHTLRS